MHRYPGKALELSFYDLFYVHEGFACMYVSALCVSSASGQKRVPGTLERELCIVVNCHVFWELNPGSLQEQ